MKSNVLLMGPAGTGKTASIISALPYFDFVGVMSVDPGFWNTIEAMKTRTKFDHALIKKIHHRYLAPASTKWDILIQNAKLINTLGNDTLQKMPGINKPEYAQFIELLTLLSNFIDENGEQHGPVDAWPANNLLFVDGLSGISRMSMDLVVGGKPVKTQPDWGVAMDNIENIVNKLTGSTLCSLVLTAHVDREPDQLLGTTKIMVQTLGQKLAPKLPQKFDEVIACVRDGDKYRWSTAAANTDLKTRRLPISDNLPPDFKQIFG